MKIKARIFSLGWGGAISEWAGPLNLGWAGLHEKITVSRPPKPRGWSLSAAGVPLATLSQKCFGYSGWDSSGKGGLPCL